MTIFTDADTVSSKTTPSSTVEKEASVESAKPTSITTPSSLEEHSIPDSGTPLTITEITSDDRGPFDDTDAPFTITQITTGELEYVHPTGFWGPFDDDNGVI